MKFNKDKCQILHLRRDKPGYTYRLIPLQSLPTLQQINILTQLGVVCKLTVCKLDPLIQINSKDINQICLQ
ncbi:hypothetical protein BTVI_145385 [Pitangus sulphuratus]|nr:hypothetical protein BTVI_145385 [Pitangus sulphuratus]